jgi:hypothetical protein
MGAVWAAIMRSPRNLPRSSSLKSAHEDRGPTIGHEGLFDEVARKKGILSKNDLGRGQMFTQGRKLCSRAGRAWCKGRLLHRQGARFGEVGGRESKVGVIENFQ